MSAVLRENDSVTLPGEAAGERGGGTSCGIPCTESGYPGAFACCVWA